MKIKLGQIILATIIMHIIIFILGIKYCSESNSMVAWFLGYFSSFNLAKHIHYYIKDCKFIEPDS